MMKAKQKGSLHFAEGVGRQIGDSNSVFGSVLQTVIGLQLQPWKQRKGQEFSMDFGGGVEMLMAGKIF